MIYSRSSMEAQLEKMRQLRTLALAGKNDEEIAREMNQTVYWTVSVRRALDIRKTKFVDIMQTPKKMWVSDKGIVNVKFNIGKEYLADLGINPDTVTDKDIHVSGKITDKKLILKLSS
jgi:hypothetical protein